MRYSQGNPNLLLIFVGKINDLLDFVTQAFMINKKLETKFESKSNESKVLHSIEENDNGEEAS